MQPPPAIQVGSDIALINAMIHVILKEGLYNLFIKKRTAQFETLKEQVENYTPEYAANITGLSTRYY